MSNQQALRFINVAHFLDHFFLLVFPTAVLALHQAWGMSYGEALALGTPAFAVFALATLPCGWLGDRWGGVQMMRVYFLGLGAAAILTGLTSGPVALSVGLAAVGLFAAIYHPVATAMVVALAEKPGRELGINGVWGNLGVALAAVITATLTAWLSWRAAFIVPGILTLLLGIAYTALSKPQTKGAGKARDRKATLRLNPSDQWRVFAVVGVSALFSGLVFNAVTVSLPKLFEERLDAAALGLSGIGAVTTTVLLLASFTQLISGRLVDRLGPRPVMIVAAGLQIPFLALLAVVPGFGVVPVTVPLMLLVFGIIPVSSWLLGHYVAPEWRSRAYGMQYLLALGVNAGVLPLIAFMHERTGGSGALFLVLAGAASLVFLVSFILPHVRQAMMETSTAARPAPASS
jgi:MFS family permease